MATLTPPAPVKEPSRRDRPAPPATQRDRDLGPGAPAGVPGDDGEAPFTPPAKRRSYWPVLVDFGLVMALFGLIIAGRPLIVVGAIIFIAALIGWVREARAEFSRLPD
ncbi:MAG: cytochrome c oxidase subunit 4 [Anaerolineales bacterium]|nr:cytochrome c oxidase subunit 4 [Anaerolineales bacterium]